MVVEVTEERHRKSLDSKIIRFQRRECRIRGSRARIFSTSSIIDVRSTFDALASSLFQFMLWLHPPKEASCCERRVRTLKTSPDTTLALIRNSSLLVNTSRLLLCYSKKSCTDSGPCPDRRLVVSTGVTPKIVLIRAEGLFFNVVHRTPVEMAVALQQRRTRARQFFDGLRSYGPTNLLRRSVPLSKVPLNLKWY